MDLKEYQKRTLRQLALFLAQSRVEGLSAAFEEVAEPDGDGLQVAYKPILDDENTPIPSLENVPYVCLRIPTGGGKTILGAHLIHTVAEAYLERERPLVLWLVPSKQIKAQTLDAFRNPKHPYRQQLDAVFGVGRVAIFDLADNGQVRPQDLTDQMCLFIGTMASARVADTEIRDLYADKEDLEPHFLQVGEVEGLEKTEDQKRFKYSFANLLKIHRPLIITDEAHNANTALSNMVYDRLSPSAILELTATPDVAASNLLVRVSASELKTEQMIKLPVVLKEHTDGWEECLQAALQRRAYLSTLAPGEAPDYIRPILLIQAENKGMTATVEVIRDHLLNNENIPEEEIKIATGEQRQLDDVDLFDPACKVSVIITKDALKEGWDCSFAYVLCSLSNQRSGTAIQQLLGRVLRMPYARTRKNPELNQAYSHVVSPAFGVVAQELTDDLERMGFNAVEAAQSVAQSSFKLEGGQVGSNGGLFPQRMDLTLPSAPDLTNIPAADRPKVTVEALPEGNGYKVSVEGAIDEATQEAIAEAVPKRHREEAKRRMANHNVKAMAVRKTPASESKPFNVPRLMFKQGHLTLEVSADLLLDTNGWHIGNYPADLSSYRYNEHTKTFLVDLDGEEVSYASVTEPQVAYMQGMAVDWTEIDVVDFLDRRVHQSDIFQKELVEWIRRGVEQLLNRGFDMAQIVRGKYVIARKLDEQIKKARLKASEDNFQQVLFKNDAPIFADFNHTYAFDPLNYPRRYDCAANYRWQKHFYAVPGELPWKKKDNTLAEEFQCAITIDGRADVDYWVRNLAHQSQFSLPTATGKTYPDFVAMMKDGRVLVIEYKGGDRVSNDDSKNKALMGNLWAKASKGKGVYLMASLEAGRGSLDEQISQALEK